MDLENLISEITYLMDRYKLLLNILYDFITIKQAIDEAKHEEMDNDLFETLDILFECLTPQERLEYLRNKLEANDNEP